MKRLFSKKVIILLLLVVVYYVLQIFHNEKFEDFIERNANSTLSTTNEFEALGYKNYSGVLHVHTNIGGHSEGSFEELILGAQSSGLDFVGMTEHVSDLFNVERFTLDGQIGSTLFVSGTEQRLADGTKLLFLGGEPRTLESNTVNSEPQESKDYESIVSVVYPKRFKGADDSFEAVETLSLHTGLRNTDRFSLLWNLLLTKSENRPLMVAKSVSRPDRSLVFYDERSKGRKIVLFGGTDSHSNIGIHLLGDSTGQRVLQLKLDPYESVFSIIRNQVLIKDGVELNQRTLIEAIRAGRVYTSMHALGDTTGFHFTALSGNEHFVIGGTVVSDSEVTFRAESPLPATLILRKDGEVVAQARGEEPLNYSTSEEGDYRIEAYREDKDTEFNAAPWILTNPIYLRKTQN